MKKVKIWNKTAIVWGMDQIFPGETDILVDDWHKKDEIHFHTLCGLRAVSLHTEAEREALITAIIYRVSVSPNTKRAEITNRLMNLDKSISGVHSAMYSEKFNIRYTLSTGESFCDSAIHKTKLLFEKLGIKDKDDNILSNFVLFQESLVYVDGERWIPFADYLRHKHGLRQTCSLWGRKCELGDTVFSVNYKNAESNFLEKMK